MPNRKAIVVGASRGIGRSIALTLASAGGWDVGLMARSVAALQSVARECAAVNKHCTVVVAPSDVCHPTAHAKAMRRCLAALQDKRRDDAEGVKGPFLHALIYCTGVDASQHTMWLGDISKSSSSSSRSMRGDSTGAVGDTMGADAPGIDAVMRPNFNGCVRTVAHCHTALIAAAAAAAEEGYDGPSIVLISSIIVCVVRVVCTVHCVCVAMAVTPFSHYCYLVADMHVGCLAWQPTPLPSMHCMATPKSCSRQAVAVVHP